MGKKTAPGETLRLPVKIESVSNGEYIPRPLSAALAWVKRTALARIERNARRTGMSRRSFVQSSCGAATVLLVLDKLAGCGGRYRVPREAEYEPAAADEALAGDEFIFDVQTHHVAVDRPWYLAESATLDDFLQTTPQAACGHSPWVKCFSRDHFIKEIFLDSDTHMAVLSALYGEHLANPLHIEEAAETRERLAMMEGAPRLRVHGIVLPQLGSLEDSIKGALKGSPQNSIAGSLEESFERMQDLAETWSISAWKLYPPWGPKGKGYWLDDPETGLRTIQHGLRLGVPLFAVHKGLPLPGLDPQYASPRDVGPAAKAFPEATFLIYHSGYEQDRREGPYDPTAERGVDRLIRSLEEHGIGKDGNVYAELGSLWRSVMTDPEQAAHVLGKLLKHVGEDRILWGTDCIWYGSPQDQIQAFRAFEITEELQEKYGYPALTRERKAKILGLNAARAYGVDAAEIQQALQWDAVSRAKQIYLENPQPSHRSYGPRSRRELLRLIGLNRGLPG